MILLFFTLIAVIYNVQKFYLTSDYIYTIPILLAFHEIYLLCKLR